MKEVKQRERGSWAEGREQAKAGRWEPLVIKLSVSVEGSQKGAVMR